METTDGGLTMILNGDGCTTFSGEQWRLATATHTGVSLAELDGDNRWWPNYDPKC